jgi:hypothetical protein
MNALLREIARHLAAQVTQDLKNSQSALDRVIQRRVADLPKLTSTMKMFRLPMKHIPVFTSFCESCTGKPNMAGLSHCDHGVNYTVIAPKNFDPTHPNQEVLVIEQVWSDGSPLCSELNGYIETARALLVEA